MKRLLPMGIICMAFLLSGCTVYHQVNLQDLLEDRIQQAEREKASEPEYHKKFYSYYLAPEIGRMEGDSTGSLLNYEGTSFLMNLNISAIINQKYYSKIENDPDILSRGSRQAYAAGSYQDLAGDNHEFSVAVYDLGRNQYLTAMRTDTVDFCAVSDALKSASLAGEMLKTAKSVKVDADAVAAAYSRKETVTFTGDKIQLFDSVAPERGRVEELFEDSDSSDGMEENSGKPAGQPSPSPSGE